jgi:putative ABC transport system permease protein
MALPRGVRRLFALRRREDVDELIDLELGHHVDMLAAQLIQQGHDPDQARRIALDRLGDLAAYRSAVADAGRERMAARASEAAATMQAGLRQAVRSLRRSPGFTAAVVASLALGIGATTTVFTFADAILLRPLPYPDPQSLVVLRHEAPGVGVLQADQSDGTYLHYRANSRALDEIATYYENVVNLSGSDEQDPERVPVAMVSSTLFEVLGARPAVGRLPVPRRERLGTDPVADPYERGASEGDAEVLLSYDLWQRRYGGDPSIVGRTIEANRAPKLVIGVLEEGFAFPRAEIGLWYPEDPDPATARAGDMYKLGIGRLAQGFSPADAARDLDRLIPSLPESYPDLSRELIEQARLRAVVVPLEDAIVGEAAPALWLLLGGMAALLLVACVNVANLVLVRAEHRRRDVAVRMALGAAHGHVLRMFGMESLLLAVLGGGLGLVGAWAAVDLLVSFVPPDGLPRLAEVRVDARVMAFAILLSLIVATVFALVPASRRERREVASTLKEGAPASVSVGRFGARRLLVASQMAVALALLVGGALMYRSFRELQRVDPGFDAAGVLTAEIAMPYSGYESYARAERLWSTLLQRVRALPGVESAGAVSGLPLVPKPAYYDVAMDVEERPSDTYAGVTTYHVSPGYFGAMHIPILEGWDAEDGLPPVDAPVVLSAAAARRLFPQGSPLGRRVRRTVGPGPWWTVAAVAGDVPEEHVGADAAEIIYVPMLETPVDPRWIPSQGALVARASVPPTTLAAEIRGIIRELDPHLPIANMRTMDGIVSDSMTRTTFTMLLLVVSGATALVLGVVGVYGVTSYVVGRRTQEIGLRVALGASAHDVERMVFGEGLRTILVGVTAGTIIAAASGQLLRSLLFGVTATDVTTYAAVTVALVLTACIATWLPARRAARVDPTEALRPR